MSARACERLLHQIPSVYHRLAFEGFVARVGHGRFGVAIRVGFQSHATLSRFPNHLLRLIPVAGCEVAGLLLHFLRTTGYLRLARPMGSNLGGSGAVQAGGLQVLPNLVAAEAVGLEVLARVTLDLRRSVPLDVDFVPKLPQAQSELRTIDGSAVLLRAEHLLWLHRAKRALMRPRHVEEHHVRVELGSRVAVDRASSVVLESCGDPVAGRVRRPISAQACLNVALERVDGSPDRLTMSIEDSAVVPTSAVSDTLSGRKRGIPTRPMSHRLERLSVGGLVSVGSR
jgi:hypothetical protein